MIEALVNVTESYVAQRFSQIGPAEPKGFWIVVRGQRLPLDLLQRAGLLPFGIPPAAITFMGGKSGELVILRMLEEMGSILNGSNNIPVE